MLDVLLAIIGYNAWKSRRALEEQNRLLRQQQRLVKPTGIRPLQSHRSYMAAKTRNRFFGLILGIGFIIGILLLVFIGMLLEPCAHPESEAEASKIVYLTSDVGSVWLFDTPGQLCTAMRMFREGRAPMLIGEIKTPMRAVALGDGNYSYSYAGQLHKMYLYHVRVGDGRDGWIHSRYVSVSPPYGSKWYREQHLKEAASEVQQAIADSASQQSY